MTKTKHLKEAPPVSAVAEPADGPVSRRSLLFLFLAALGVRMLYLGRADLWGDEISFVELVTRPASVGKVFSNLWDNFLGIGHLPLAFMVQRLFLDLMGWFASDLEKWPMIQRIPAVLWGSATVPLFYMFCLKIVPRHVALYAALMLTFFFFPVYYSREAYVYAPFMFFAVASLHRLYLIAVDGRTSLPSRLALLGLLIATSYCHMTGAFLSLVLFVGCTLILVVNKYPVYLMNQAQPRKTGLQIWLISLGALAAVAPFYVRVLLSPTPHYWPSPPAALAVIRDLVGKIFLGCTLPAELLAWVVLLGGFLGFYARGSKRPERLTLLFIILGTSLGIFLGAISTQYSSRYFYVIAAPLYLVLAAGIDWWASRIGRIIPGLSPQAPRVGWVLVGLLIGAHLILFLPLGYQLTAKSLDFGALARWLNAHLPPGTPYVFESGYDQRFVPGFFPTPGLVAAVPYVHGPGPEEMERLRQRQQQFFYQFPEACFVEASRHGAEPNSSVPPWEWPHQFFKHVDYVRNPPLQNLIRMGINPGYLPDVNYDKEYVTPIWYNLPEDIEEIWRASGYPLRFVYDLWQCAQINQYTYAHVARGSWATVRVKNLRDQPVRGKFVITGGLAGPEQSFDIAVQLNDATIHQSKKWPGQMWELETSEVTVSTGEQVLKWGVPGPPVPQVQALMILDIRFVETTQPQTERQISESK